MGVLILIAVLSAPFVVVLLSRPVERRLALRYPRRRPVEALLVVLGALLGTGIITGSLVVGDTIDRSIRAEAYDQLGPIDELVSVSGLDDGAAVAAELADLASPDIDGVVSFATAPAAVTGAGPSPLGQPRAQVIEVDFSAADAFGGGDTTGVSGPTPASGHAAVTDDLASRLELSVGDAVVVYAYGQAVELEIDRIAPREGIAGFWQIDSRQQAYNVLVGPGFLADVIATAIATADPTTDTTGVEPPTVHVAVSNTGGVESGAVRTDTVTALIEAELTRSNLDPKVQPVKQDTLDIAAEVADSLTQLYFTLGMFAVAAGILLLVNIFVMLTDDRRSEMGMMRALGLRRLPLVRAYAAEGWAYSLAGAALGAGLGIGFGWVISWRAEDILSSGDELYAVDFTFAWRWSTLLQGAAIGFVISLVTIVATSARVSRLNVIAAIRDLPTVRRTRPRRRVAGLGLAAIVLGVVWTAAGLSAPNAYGTIIGPMLVAVGLVPIVGRVLPIRPVTLVVAVAVLVWGATFPWALRGLDIEVSVPIFLVQGIAMAGAAVTLVSLFQEGIGHALARVTGNSLPVRLGLAYPVARRFRTAMTLGMFAVVILTLVYIAMLSHMFGTQVDDITADLSGGFGVIVTTNPTDPVPTDELAALPGVTAVAPLSYGTADFTRPAEDPLGWPVTGFGPELAAAPLAMQDLGSYDSAEAAFAAVLADPGLIIVDPFFLVTGAGPPTGTLDPGDTLTMTDPVSGRSRELTVAALAEDDFLFAGGYVSQQTFAEVFGERAVPSRFYVGADGVTPDGGGDDIVDAIRRTFVSHGADATTVRTQVETLQAQNAGFFTLMQQFVGVGLIVGTAGIGVIMVRAVRERRREVGVLRSLGFQPGAVARAFLVEAAFVAVEGVAIGVAVALIGSYGLVQSGQSFVEGFDWSVPVPSLAIIVGIALVTSILTALWPALRASHIRPAAALRVTD